MRIVAQRARPLIVVAVVLASSGIATASRPGAGGERPAGAGSPAVDGSLRGVARSSGFVPATSTSTSASTSAARPLLGPSGLPASPPARHEQAAVSTREGASPGRSAARAPAPIGGGFDALRNARPILSPSDSTGALGDSWFMTAVNVRTAVYSRAGAAQFPSIRLRSLGGVLPERSFEFDPKVVYDQYDDHFVLVFLANERATAFTKSWIVIATVSDAQADDPSSWCVTRIAGDQYRGDGRQWADYPGLGYDADRVTLTTNQFGFSRGYAGTQILSMPKADLYDCDAGLRGTVFAGARTRNPDGSKSFTVQPAQTVGGTEPSTQYLLEFQYGRRGGSKLVVFRIRRTDAGLRLWKAQVPVDRARPALAATQAGEVGPDTVWDPGDLRLVNAWYDADLHRLFAAHTIRNNVEPSRYVEAATSWYELRPAGKLRSSEVTRSGVIGTSLRDYGWPVVATDTLGDLFITYSRAGSRGGGEYLSAWAAEVRPSDAVSEVLLKAGEATYDFGPGLERWGDYNGISRDPADGTLIATVNQYAIGDGRDRTRLWRQWVDVVHDA